MNSSCKSDQMQIMKSNVRVIKNYKNKSHMVKAFDVLQSLRKDEVLCDIRLETDDGTIIYGHKLVLLSASDYFHAMFTNFGESYKDVVKIRYLDSTILQLLVDFIYTGKITVSEENVLALLPAANLLQLDNAKEACAEFLQAQLDPTNCLGIRAFADLYGCSELFSSSESYIKKQFLYVVKSDEFLSLSSEGVINLISSNVLNAPEEKVYECVIDWVRHELDMRYDSLPILMYHVRLPLVSIDYISKIVVEEPLLKNSPKCKDFLTEALNFHALKAQQVISIPQTMRYTPRSSGQKIILVFNESLQTHWYDPETNLWQILPEISLMEYANYYCLDKLTFFKEYYVNFLTKNNYESDVKILSLSLDPPRWVVFDNMLTYREGFGFGVSGDCLYTVGGCSFQGYLNSAEVYDTKKQKWQKIANLSLQRADLSVGVLDNLIYAVGGCSDDNNSHLKSAECYDPSLDTWTPIAEMSVCRSGFGLGVMDGVMYAVGGENASGILKSVEIYTPSSGVWTSIADMHLPRSYSRVFALDGLLYVVSGVNSQSSGRLDSIEIYNPNINTWTLEKMSKSIIDIVAAAIVDKELVTNFFN